MRKRLAVIISVFSTLSPICAIFVMLFIEQELVEAVLSGLVVGCLIGTVLGIIALILNRGENRLVKLLSVIPMCPLVIYILLLIPQFIYV